MNYSAYYSAVAFIVILFGTAVFMASMSKREKAKKSRDENKMLGKILLTKGDDGLWCDAGGNLAHGFYSGPALSTAGFNNGVLRMRIGVFDDECSSMEFERFTEVSVCEPRAIVSQGSFELKQADPIKPMHGYVLSKDANARRQKVVDELARRTGLWSERKAKYKLEAARKMMIIRGLKAHTEQALFAGICDRYNSMPADEVLALASGNK